ncbi:MAG TPA: hypothetical protein PKG54_12840 [Phycisphaerae bacterium]|jgi:hypothetical protein|nr:hypothetical protein [Phycisphaerae bacterium]HOB75397.1 hypothetical protein [Phycisphaerae bacterium]HOJ55931.1 hypothetical protein [Phycisphaerae bacterium]HOL26685.1 hypothetical protein [Phycisphaerae bacterium]HPP20566.1 hypothetical protein [Phycisphaerae bacterium]
MRKWLILLVLAAFCSGTSCLLSDFFGSGFPFLTVTTVDDGFCDPFLDPFCDDGFITCDPFLDPFCDGDFIACDPFLDPFCDGSGGGFVFCDPLIDPSCF